MATINVRLSAHKPSTRRDYDGHSQRFARFCSDSGFECLPASTATVLAWLTHDVALTVRMKNVQPYLSAVNDAHVESKVGPPPALGDDVVRHVGALASKQRALRATKSRLQLPAEAVVTMIERVLALDVDALLRDYAILQIGRAAIQLLRARVAVVVDYLHFNRGDTGVRLANSDVLAVGDYHVLRKRALKAGTGTAATNVTLLPHSAVSDLRALLSVWRQVQKGICVDWQGAASGYCLWWLPWDGPGAASAKWPQAKMNTWVKLALASQKTVAPPGFAFTYHSLRAGAATAAHSIGVSERKIRTMGNWGPQSTAIDRYIDPVFPASPAAFRLFGWMLPPSARPWHVQAA